MRTAIVAGSLIAGMLCAAFAQDSEALPDFDALWKMRDPATTRQVFRQL